MKSGLALRRKKTNLAAALANAYTQNASGTYVLPYGANSALIGGRGPSGYSPSGGYYASGGNYAGGGNQIIYMYGYSYTDFYDYANGNHVYSTGDDPWGPNANQPPTYYYSANIYAPTGAVYPGNSIRYYTVSGYYATNQYNPTYYNPTYYNPYYPGTAAPAVNIGGVYFPGGNASSLAPTVSPAPSTMAFTSTGTSISVPSGGYVVFTPIRSNNN